MTVHAIYFLLGMVAATVAIGLLYDCRPRRSHVVEVEEQFGLVVEVGAEPLASYSTWLKPRLGEFVTVQFAGHGICTGRVRSWRARPTIRRGDVAVQYDVELMKVAVTQ